MSGFVDRAGAVISRFPAAAVATIVVLTVIFGGFAAQQQVAVDIMQFAPEGELQAVYDRIDREFGASEGRVQVIVDAGPGGNVLDAEGLVLAERLVEHIEDVDLLTDRLADDAPMGRGGVVAYAHPVVQELARLDIRAEQASPAFVDVSRQRAFEGRQGRRARSLLSEDFDGQAARGGIVLVRLAPDLDASAREESALAVAAAVDEVDPGFHEVHPFSFALLNQEMESSMEEDLPFLLGVSFLLIIGILWLLFRRVSDVALGAVGLMVAIVWMGGISVLLGPDYLGLTGAFSQVAIAVPVLLVGLGIDYSVHLSSRYREERGRGVHAVPAAHTAVRTVGVALTLATITTMIGFASNAVSPLPPIADFGWFAAAGILSAFVVLGVLVPAGRVLLDRRHDADEPPTTVTDGDDHRRPGRLARVPARAPGLILGLGLLVAGGFALLAGNLETTFSQEEFIPDGSAAGVVLDRVDELFGGDVGEQTDALVDGDVRDAEVLATMADLEVELAHIEGVSTTDDRAEVTSPTGLVRQLDEIVDAVRQQLAAQFALLHDPDAAADLLPLPDELTLEDLPPDMREEIEQAGGLPGDADQLPIDDLEALERRLPDGVSATEALLSVLPGAELVEAMRSEIAEQAEGQGPDLDAETTSELAALEPEEIGYGSLADTGYPVEELSGEVTDLLRAGDRLARHGWTGTGVAPDADPQALLAVVEEHLGTQLEAVLAEDAALMSISTRVGEEGADRLVAELSEVLAPLGDQVGGQVSIVSQQLLIDQTLTRLTDSQINAIVVSLAAALLLLTLYYGMTVRRPALGPITMIPALLAVPLVLGTMWLVGLSFNALTATVASIAIGIGVPYGIHITNRFMEQRELGASTEVTIGQTLTHTGRALVGSAVTTASGFGVLMLSDLTPIRQFGGLTAVTILYALITALLLEASALVLWDRWHRRDEEHGEAQRTEGPTTVDPDPVGVAQGPPASEVT